MMRRLFIKWPKKFCGKRWYCSKEKSLEPKSDQSLEAKGEGSLEAKGERSLAGPDPGACLAEITKKKKVKVTLLAADNRMGQSAALSLKTNGQLVQELRLWDITGPLRGMAMDLNHIPTSVKVRAYVGSGQLDQALREADIVAVMGGAWGGAEVFHANSEPIRELTRAIVLSAPRALVGVAVHPLTQMLAFIAEVERSVGAFCPERLVGVLSLEEMRARSLLAARLAVPPSVVQVKLTGGGTPSTLVPVIEGGPGGEYLGEQALVITHEIRALSDEVRRAYGGGGPDIIGGLAVANFVRAAAEGMCTDRRPTVSVLVRTSALPGVPYLVLPAKLGPTGVESTSGIPKLTEREFKLLVKALPLLKEEIATGETWAHSKRHTALSVQ